MAAMSRRHSLRCSALPRDQGAAAAVHGEDEKPEGARAGRTRFRQFKDELSKTPASTHEPGVAGRGRGVSFLLVRFSLDKQRK
ncbi:MAG: hypothetical protein R3F12_11220 [Lysobacteraceae bacterium]